MQPAPRCASKFFVQLRPLWGKLVQIRLYGAELVPVEGPRPRATELYSNTSTALEPCTPRTCGTPLFIEGLKTLTFELAEQLDWTAPDAVICPVGAGSILLGLYRGFLDLQQAGLVNHLPRLIARPGRTRLAAVPRPSTPVWT